MDENDVWMDDGIEELVLGEPGIFDAPVRHRGFPARRIVWRPKEEDEDQYIFRMQLEAIQKPIVLKAERDAAKGRSLAGLERGRRAQEIDRFFSPPEGPKMTQMDKKVLEERSVLKKAEASLRKKEEDEATKKQIAMNIRMAKVRAAKRNNKAKR